MKKAVPWFFKGCWPYVAQLRQKCFLNGFTNYVDTGQFRRVNKIIFICGNITYCDSYFREIFPKRSSGFLR